MIRFALLLALFLAGAGGNAALYLRAGTPPETVSGEARVTLGNVALLVPKALIREPAQVNGGRLERLDLALGMADFAPLPPPTPAKPFTPMPERLTILIGPATGSTGPVEQFQVLYARFLARETWSNPGGLVMRQFRSGTPYEDREIYLGAGGARLFIALCPREALGAVEPCVAQIRTDGVDAELRFDARHLPEWKRIIGETTRQIGLWRAKASETAQLSEPAEVDHSRSSPRIAISKK